MITRLVLMIALLLSQQAIIAQADSILSLPPSEREFALYDWMRQEHEVSSPAHVYASLGRLQAEFTDKDDKLARVAWYLKMDTKDQIFNYPTLDEKLEMLDSFQMEAQSRHWKAEALVCSFQKGFWLFESSRFGEGMEIMLRDYDELKSIGWPCIVAGVLINSRMGYAFYKFGDYQNAIEYFKRSLEFKIPKQSILFPFQTMNTIGLAFEKLFQYDSAIYYMQKSYAYAQSRNDSLWMSLVSGNLGSVYLKNGQKALAKKHLEQDFHGSIQVGNMGSAANAGTLLANIELEEGNILKAEEYIRFSRAHLDTSNLDGMIGYATNLYTYHKLRHEYAKAVAYADSLRSYLQRKNRKFDKNILDQAEIRVQLAKYDADVKSLEAARSRQVILRNALLVILALVAMVVILWIKRIMQKRKSEQEKLSYAQSELNRYTKSLLEKNELIQSFRDEIEKLKDQRHPVEADKSVEISTLMHAEILTDEDWRHFRTLFDTVFPGFLVRLKAKINDLTPAEMRILALTKLQLQDRDMAEMLGISIDSIRKTRYRLRKKINLPEEGSLEELVSMI